MIVQMTIRVFAPTFGYAIIVNKFSRKSGLQGSKQFSVPSNQSPLKANPKETTVEIECKGKRGQKLGRGVGLFLNISSMKGGPALTGNAEVGSCDKEKRLMNARINNVNSLNPPDFG